MPSKTAAAGRVVPGPFAAAVGLRSPKLAELVAEQLRAAMLSGELPEGHRLPPEHELVASYGVSRGVVREAMRLLETQGLLEIRRGNQGGAVVTHRTSGLVREATYIGLKLKGVTIGEVIAATEAIEPAAARLAAERRPKAASEALLAHVAYHRTVLDDLEAHAVALQDFRKLLIDNCGNAPLILMTSALYEVMRDQMSPLLGVFLQRLDRAQITRKAQERTLAWHEHFAQAVGRGDPQGAERLWRRYMKVMRDNFFAVVPPDQPLR